MIRKTRVCINGITENHEIRGPVRAIYELAAHLDTARYEIILLAGEWQRNIYHPLEGRIDVRYFDIGRSKVSRAMFFFFSMPKLLRSMTIDVYHIPDTNPLPIARCGARIVSTIYDSAEFVVPFRFSWYQAWYRRIISKLQGHGSDAVLTGSESSRKDLVRYLGIASDSITVTRLGVTPLTDGDPVRLRSSDAPQLQYILYVGVLENAKNVDRLVEAYATLAPGLRQQFALYLVGRKANAYARICQLIKQHGIGDRIRVFGYIADDELNRLYAGACIFAYLSEYEGFGLPILEAMRYGLPVLAANKTSLPEVAGEAALLVNTDVASIAHGLDTLIRDADLRHELARKGLERADSFRWENTARQTEHVYDQVLEQARITRSTARARQSQDLG